MDQGAVVKNAFNSGQNHVINQDKASGTEQLSTERNTEFAQSTSAAGNFLFQDSHGHLSSYSNHQYAFSESSNSSRAFVFGSNGILHTYSRKKISFWSIAKPWFKNPVNVALLIWVFAVVVSGAIFFMVLTGMLNNALPSESQRHAWFEISNQILIALMTLMALYLHPRRIHLFLLLCRWREDDIIALRKELCRNGTQKPHERRHMLVVICLMQLYCFAQYALFGFNMSYPIFERPAIGVAILMSVAISSAIAAGLYRVTSPLGRDYESGNDLESPGRDGLTLTELEAEQPEIRHSTCQYDADAKDAKDAAGWRGGLCEFWDDPALAGLSIFCGCCMFGWNTERLGFGNMYVHIFTIFLLCTAPFVIFILAAAKLELEAARDAFLILGLVLCILGLLYGAYWRTKMREKFNLRGYYFCFRNPDASDYALWLCCYPCVLSQEIRTGDDCVVVRECPGVQLSPPDVLRIN